MSIDVAQIDESGPRIASLLLQLVPVAQMRISQVSASATVPEKPAGSSREAMKRPGLDGRAQTAHNFPALSACQSILDGAVCTIRLFIPYADVEWVFPFHASTSTLHQTLHHIIRSVKSPNHPTSE